MTGAGKLGNHPKERQTAGPPVDSLAMILAAFKRVLTGSVLLAATLPAVGQATTPPPAPAPLVVSESGGRVLLNWANNSTAETGFRVTRQPAFEEGAFSVPADTTQVFDYPGRGTFVYTVVAFNPAGDSPAVVSSSVRIRNGEPGSHGIVTSTSTSGEFLAAPRNLRLTVDGLNVRLQWQDRSSNETFFEIRRETLANGVWQNAVNFQAAANITAYSDAAGEGQYRYRVRSGNSTTYSVYTAWVICLVTGGTQSPPATSPAAPSNLAVADIGSGRAMVSWTDNSTDETGFVVERDPPFSGGAMTLAANSTALTDQCGNGTFSYRVKAINDVGSSAYAGWLAVNVTSGGSGPTGPTPSSSSPPVVGTIGDDGWTVITPSSDTRTIYVSSSVGNDANNGASESSPKRSIAAGVAVLRSGYPDQLLLKRGDTWTESLGHWVKSGRSPSEPMVISAYGSGTDRPLLRTGLNSGLERCGGGGSPMQIDHLALIGLSFFPDAYDGNNGTPHGLFWLGAGSHILIEDCRYEGYFNGVTVQQDNGRVSAVAVRRCVIVDNYGNQGHAQGIFTTGVDGLAIEENVLDHNGWKTGVSEPDIFKHNIYITVYNTGVSVTGNILTRASSHGLQLRCGGRAEGNVFVRNPLAMFVGTGEGFQSVVRNNVIQEATDIDSANPRGFGIETLDTYDSLIEDNVIAHSRVAHNFGYAFAASTSPESAAATSRYRAVFKNNIVFDWAGTGFYITASDLSVYDDIEFLQNRVCGLAGGYLAVYTPSAVDLQRFTFSGNTYWSGASASQWFYRNASTQSFPTWAGSLVESGSSATQSTFPDPQRTTGTYQGTLGGPATFEGFIEQARRQSHAAWRNEYTAAAVNAYIRAGFNVTP
jgi:hypothetical protein